MAALQPIIVFTAAILSAILEFEIRCVKLLQIMSGVIPRNSKQKRRLYLKPFSEVHKRSTHTHTTHDDSIRRNAMRCISPKNDLPSQALHKII